MIKKVVIIKKKNKQYLFLCNLYIKSNLKNTIVILTKKEGKVLKQWSTKAAKKTKFKKNSSYNIYLLGKKINTYIINKQIKALNIIFIGNGIGKRNIIKTFNFKKFFFFLKFDKTPILFNGCKKKKSKRR